MRQARLEALYNTKLKPELKDKLGFDNIMQVPRITKIVLNVGSKEAVKDSKVINFIQKTLTDIAGQSSVRTLAKKSIAGFKIREGMPLGVKVTLRRRAAYTFFDKLLSIALPRVRDFQGVTTKFDKGMNYNLGIKEWNIFPEVKSTAVNEHMTGLNITIATTAKSYQEAHALLSSFGMPFKKNDK